MNNAYPHPSGAPQTPEQYSSNFAEVFAHKMQRAGMPLTNEEKMMVVGKVCAAAAESCHKPSDSGTLDATLDNAHDTLFSLKESIRRLTLPRQGRQEELSSDLIDSIIRIAERSDHTARGDMQQFRQALMTAASSVKP